MYMIQFLHSCNDMNNINQQWNRFARRTVDRTNVLARIDILSEEGIFGLMKAVILYLRPHTAQPRNILNTVKISDTHRID